MNWAQFVKQNKKEWLDMQKKRKKYLPKCSAFYRKSEGTLHRIAQRWLSG